MSFLVTAIGGSAAAATAVTGAVGSIAGAVIGAKGAKGAANTAAAGSQAEIDYLEESRDMAREDQRPWIEAGGRALNALESMVGIGGGPTSENTLQPWSTGRDGSSGGPPGSYSSTEPSHGVTGGEAPWQNEDGSLISPEDRQAMAYNRMSQLDPDMASRFKTGYVSQNGQQEWDTIFGRAYGGNISGGALYNVNELGPENVFNRGAVTRSSNPRTIPPSPTGYVGSPMSAIGGGSQQAAFSGAQSQLGSFQGSIGGAGGYAQQMGVQQGAFNQKSAQMGANPFARQMGAYGQQAGAMRGGGQGSYGLIGRDRGGDLWGEGGYGVVNPNQQIPGGTSGGLTATDTGSYGFTPGLGGNQPAGGGEIPQGLLSGPKDGAGDYVNSSIPPKENPGGVEGGYNFMTDPGYEFRREEGTRAIERGAAARGGLLSGGTGRALQRYGQDYASNEYTNVYNRIANIAGLGQVSAGQSGQYAMNAGQGMGTAAAQGGYASAYGQQAQGNAWANAANQIGQLPWGKVFEPKTNGGYAP